MNTTQPGTGPSILAMPPRVRTRHAYDPNFRMGFRGQPNARDRVSPSRCTCDSGAPNSCPWHKGRYGQGPRERDAHAIPRISGLSAGAFLLFCYLHRTQWWAIEESERRSHLTAEELRARGWRRIVNCCPVRLDMARAIGGRNSRTRPRDENGVPSIGERFEKGTADESTITAYLHELRSARLPDGRPLLVSKRWPNSPADYYIHAEVLLDPDPHYSVSMKWDVSTDVPTADTTTPNGAGAQRAASITSPLLETPLRLGSGTRTSHAEVETREEHAIGVWVAAAEAEPWWPSWADQVRSIEYARRELARVLGRLRGEGLKGEDFARVYALLSHQHEREKQAPKSYAAFFLAAARKGWHTPKPYDPTEATAALVAAEEREREAVRRRIASHSIVTEAAAVVADPAGECEEREMSDEDHARWRDECMAILNKGRGAPAPSSPATV